MVSVDKNKFEDEDKPFTVEEALEATVLAGKVGNLKVDPKSLSLGDVGMQD